MIAMVVRRKLVKRCQKTAGKIWGWKNKSYASGKIFNAVRLSSETIKLE